MRKREKMIFLKFLIFFASFVNSKECDKIINVVSGEVLCVDEGIPDQLRVNKFIEINWKKSTFRKNQKI